MLRYAVCAETGFHIHFAKVYRDKLACYIKIGGNHFSSCSVIYLIHTIHDL